MSIVSAAIISADEVYRYRLTRRWTAALGLPLPFLMLNPSTADHELDDPTIVRCMRFARDLGYDGLGVWNLYAFRATKPAVMFAAAEAGVDIVGPENDRRLRNLFAWCATSGVPVVAGWGMNARADRVDEILAMPYASEVLRCLGVTQSGIPKHPLARGKHRIPDGAPLLPWPVAA